MASLLLGIILQGKYIERRHADFKDVLPSGTYISEETEAGCKVVRIITNMMNLVTKTFQRRTTTALFCMYGFKFALTVGGEWKIKVGILDQTENSLCMKSLCQTIEHCTIYGRLMSPICLCLASGGEKVTVPFLLFTLYANFPFRVIRLALANVAAAFAAGLRDLHVAKLDVKLIRDNDQSKHIRVAALCSLLDQLFLHQHESFCALVSLAAVCAMFDFKMRSDVFSVGNKRNGQSLKKEFDDTLCNMLGWPLPYAIPQVHHSAYQAGTDSPKMRHYYTKCALGNSQDAMIAQLAWEAVRLYFD